MLTYDRYLLPTTLAGALSALGERPQDTRVVAGATDLVPYAREGRGGDVHVPVVLDLSRVAELQGYSIAGRRVRLNANIVFQDFLRDDRLKAHLPSMPYCAIWFADDQVREQATLTGNVVNASPAADGTPPLLTMNADIELASLRDGAVTKRTIKVEDFVTGPGKTMMQPGEIVTAITVDSMEGYAGSFEKVGQRRSLVISKVSATALVRTDATGTMFDDVRIAIGGVGPVPQRLYDVEALLKNRTISSTLIAEASAGTASRVASRSMIEYRKHVVRGFVQAAIEDALIAAGVPLSTQPHKEQADV